MTRTAKLVGNCLSVSLLNSSQHGKMYKISIVRLTFKIFEKSKTSAGRIKLSVGAGLARAGRSLDTSGLYYKKVGNKYI